MFDSTTLYAMPSRPITPQQRTVSRLGGLYFSAVGASVVSPGGSMG